MKKAKKRVESLERDTNHLLRMMLAVTKRFDMIDQRLNRLGRKKKR